MSDAVLQLRLADLVARSDWFITALRQVRSLGLADWCIGAGAVRNLVWDALHDRSAPSWPDDVDVAWFDEADVSAERDAALLATLRARAPHVPWEVTNQAGVHRWFEGAFGHAVAPLRSLDEAVASWPEYATAVGITLADDDTLRILAPHGLDDLFGLVVRRNPVRVSVETYRRRVAGKGYVERWPRVTVVPA